jgi:hypothetical protein
MEQRYIALQDTQAKLLNKFNNNFKREIFNQINWEYRVI